MRVSGSDSYALLFLCFKCKFTFYGLSREKIPQQRFVAIFVTILIITAGKYEANIFTLHLTSAGSRYGVQCGIDAARMKLMEELPRKDRTSTGHFPCTLIRPTCFFLGGGVRTYGKRADMPLNIVSRSHKPF